jgi:hypothetical protein
MAPFQISGDQNAMLKGWFDERENKVRDVKIRQITSWLSKILLFLGFAVISIFSAATLAHR